MEREDAPDFTTLLHEAVTRPGCLAEALTAFTQYSLTNQLLAYRQCMARNLPVGPLASFNTWKSRGRQVRRGERGIGLRIPRVIKVAGKITGDAENGPAAQEETKFVGFTIRRGFFVLDQTDGRPYAPQALSAWEKTTALEALDIREEPFGLINGRILGYARERSIAISPVADELADRVLFHELAHVVLGHTAAGTMHDEAAPTREIKELEAECVAMICAAALGLPGVEYSRGYIQTWWGTQDPVPDQCARRILSAADKILKAGRGRDEARAKPHHAH